jgi:hypothetical protein
MHDKRHSKILIAIVPLLMLILLGGVTSGCGATAAAPSPSHELVMAAMEGMPAEVRAAPALVKQAYQFAVANPDVLQELPCYCGCGAMGHASNYACYVQGVDAAGKPAYDPHALGCSICVDITQDAMRLLRQGKNVQEIRSYVDTTYARYGPSNMPKQ